VGEQTNGRMCRPADIQSDKQQATNDGQMNRRHRADEQMRGEQVRICTGYDVHGRVNCNKDGEERNISIEEFASRARLRNTGWYTGQVMTRGGGLRHCIRSGK